MKKIFVSITLLLIVFLASCVNRATRYTITFNSNGGSTVSQITVTDPDDFEMPTNPTKNGYTFGGWYLNSNLTNEWEFDEDNSTNITVYAKWNLVTYTIAYQNLEGTTHSNPLTYTIESTINSLSAPSNRAGFQFVGWFDSLTGGSAVTSITNSTGNKTLYARWQVIVVDKEEYVVIFNTNGGSVLANQTLEEDSLIVFGSTTKNGYTLDGWYKEATFVNQWQPSTDKVTANITLYAKWVPTNYTITYQNTNGASNANPPTFTIETATITLLPLDDTPTHEFVGWFDSATGGLEVLTINLGSTGNKTIYARFEIKTYTIEFITNGGNDIDDQTVNANTLVEVIEPTRVHYAFSGWFKDENLTIVWDLLEDRVLGDLILYAKWSPDRYSIIYNNVGDAENDNPTSFTIETPTITLLPLANTPTHEFIGWFDAELGGNQVLTIPEGSFGEKVLYARFIIEQVTITFETNGGNTIANQTVDADTLIVVTPPTKLYYDFAGWYKEDTLTTPWNLATDKVLEDITLYAKWTPQIKTLTIMDKTEVFTTMPFAYNAPIIVEDLEKAGFIFLGLFKDSNFNIPFEVDGTEIMTTNSTVYAMFAKEEVTLNYFDFNNLDIIKVTINSSGTHIILAEDGNLYIGDIYAFNYVKLDYDAIYIQLILEVDGESILNENELIVNFFFSGWTLLVETSDGRILFIDLSEDIELFDFTNDFDLESNEEIVSFYGYENFYRFITSNNRIFYLGNFTIGTEEIEYFDLFEVTSEFTLNVGETIVMNQNEYSDNYFGAANGLIVKTSERFLMPTIIYNELTDSSEVGHFVDLSDVYGSSYFGSSLDIDENNIYLMLVDSDSYLVISLDNGTRNTEDEDIVGLNPSEEIVLFFAGAFITNQNRIVMPGSPQIMTTSDTIDGEITNILIMAIDGLTLVLQTSTDKYYLTNIMDEGITNYNVTLVPLSDYRLDGVWYKDGKAYLLDTTSFVMNEFNLDVLSLVQEVVAGGTVATLPNLVNSKYQFVGWDGLTADLLLDDMSYWPVFDYPPQNYFDVDITLGTNEYSDYIYIYEIEYTYEQFMNILMLELGLGSQFTYEVFINEELVLEVDTILLVSGDTIEIIGTLSDDYHEVKINYVDADGIDQFIYLYLLEGTITNGDIESELSYMSITGVFLDMALSIPFDMELTGDIELFIEVEHEYITITFIIANDIDEEDFDIYLGKQNPLSEVSDWLDNNYDYYIIGLFIDEEFTQWAYLGDLSDGATLYIKVNNEAPLQFIGNQTYAPTTFYYGDTLQDLGYYLFNLEQLIINDQKADKYYLDEELTIELKRNDLIPFNTTTIYVSYITVVPYQVTLHVIGTSASYQIMVYEVTDNISTQLMDLDIFFGSEWSNIQVKDGSSNPIGTLSYFNEQIPEDIYVDANDFVIFTFVGDDISFEVWADYDFTDWRINQIIASYGYDQATVTDDDANVVNYFNISEGIDKTFNIEVSILPKTTVYFHLGGDVIEFENVFMGLNYSLMYDFENYLINVLEMTFDWIELFLDEEMENPWWDSMVTEDFILYVNLVIIEKTDVTVYYDETESFVLQNMFVQVGQYWNVESEIGQHLNNLLIPFTNIYIYTDSNLEEAWDGEVTELLTLYIEILYFQYTDITVYYEDIDNFILYSMVLGEDQYNHIHSTIFGYLWEYDIETMEIHINEELDSVWDGEVVEDLVLYLKITLVPKTTVTIYYNETSVQFENVTLGYNYDVFNYFVIHLYNEEIPFDWVELYTDVDLVHFWSNEVIENLELYADIILY